MSIWRLGCLLLATGQNGGKQLAGGQIHQLLSRSNGSWKRLFCSESSATSQAGRVASRESRNLLQNGSKQGTSSAIVSDKTAFQRYLEELRNVPTMPLILGFAGAIPFIVLSPPILKQLKTFLPIPSEVFHHAAVLQVGYGACILSFLGAVHWGAALSSKLSGPIALKIANERYSWSVLPALLAWPTTAMEPGPASLILGVLLPLVYVADTRFHRVGYLPKWYMTLRGPLTALASFGMLTSAIYFLEVENEKIRQRGS